MNRYNYRQFPITCGLIITCVIVYIWTSLTYSFDMNAAEGYQAGGFMPLAIFVNHDYYRFLTANFIHFGLWHLLMNMISLSNIGPFIEKIFGYYRYAILILGSALGTTGLPYLYYRFFLSPTDQMGLTVSGGASGIILGLLGGLCFLAWRYHGVYQHVFRSIVPSLVLVVFMSVLIPSVSISGHLGGFTGGFLTTALLNQFWPHRSWQSPYFHQNSMYN